MVRRPLADRRLGRPISWSSSAPSCGAQEPHIYVANWFYLAFIVTIAVLHLGNNAAIPVSLFSSKSYIVWSGVQDAMVQWWYGHNAVGFFLTAGFLAIMYYFIPKRADRPVYSYRLSIIHFWALIFLYIWAGPHHLHYTALPDWAQTLGMTFSIMLWMPSWGGMINGLMTLSGAWDKLRTDPVLRMMVVSVAFYGMATFEGPLMSIKIGQLALATTPTGPSATCIPARSAGSATSRSARIYCLVPWLWNRSGSIRSSSSTGTSGSRPSASCSTSPSMWVSGILQGLMWRAYTSSASSNIPSSRPSRRCIRSTSSARSAASLFLARRADHGLEPLADRRIPARSRPRRPPSRWRRPNEEATTMSLWQKHAILEKNSIFLLIGILIVIAIGGLVEIVPLFYLKSTIEKVDGVRPYTPLELAGRNIYVREGCYLCHSQMIRPLRDEVERYGHYSLAAESMYDHPFQWGSKRTGPDLARVGGKYSDDWHRDHLQRSALGGAGSVMPGYRGWRETELDYRAYRRRSEGAGDARRALYATT